MSALAAALDVLDRFDSTDPVMAALGVLDAKLGVVCDDLDRVVSLLERVAGAVDVRIETP